MTILQIDNKYIAGEVFDTLDAALRHGSVENDKPEVIIENAVDGYSIDDVAQLFKITYSKASHLIQTAKLKATIIKTRKRTDPRYRISKTALRAYLASAEGKKKYPGVVV
jgi:DNA-directed RNA polymerase specialized sigma24 family protein